LPLTALDRSRRNLPDFTVGEAQYPGIPHASGIDRSIGRIDVSAHEIHGEPPTVRILHHDRCMVVIRAEDARGKALLDVVARWLAAQQGRRVMVTCAERLGGIAVLSRGLNMLVFQ
jgi:hypothetical protein